MVQKVKATPLRYPGGKSRATKFLFDHLPQTKISEYREPFLGGGSMAIEFTKRYPKTPILVNDLYAPLYNFWLHLRDSGYLLQVDLTELKKKAENYKDRDASHRELFEKAKEYVSKNPYGFESAMYFFVINKCSFSGLGESSGFSVQASDQNFSMSNIQRLYDYSGLIQNWIITNKDYRELLVDVEEDAFIFLDPPYDINSFLYGRKGNMHEGFDHVEFSKEIDKLRCNWMVTYNSDEIIKEYFSKYPQIEWGLTYTMRSTGDYRKTQRDRKELVITNYSTKQAELEDFFDE